MPLSNETYGKATMADQDNTAQAQTTPASDDGTQNTGGPSTVAPSDKQDQQQDQLPGQPAADDIKAREAMASAPAEAAAADADEPAVIDNPADGNPADADAEDQADEDLDAMAESSDPRERAQAEQERAEQDAAAEQPDEDSKS